MSKNQMKKTTEQQKNTPDSVPNKEQKLEAEKTASPALESSKKAGNHTKDEAQAKQKEGAKKIEGKLTENKKELNKKSPSFLSRFKWFFMWLIVFAAIAAAVFFTRKDLDWQVQHINDLQTEVAQLNQAQQALESRIDSKLKETEQRLLAKVEANLETKMGQSVQSHVSQSLASPEHQAIVTQADIDKIQQATQQQLTQLQEKLSALGDQAIQQTQKVLLGASDLAETTKQALEPTVETEKALAEIEQKLQTQLSQVSNKLLELFEFKSEQQALGNQTVESQPAEKSSLEQFKYWVIEMNTQWLLRGNVAETRAQLTALQQAIAVSEIPKTTYLASLIGQDLAYLERYQTQQAQETLNTHALKQAIQRLSAAHSEPKNRTSVDSATQQQGGGNISNTSETTSNLTLDSAVDRLKQTFSGLVSIKKRDSEAEITQVESLILQDVLVQRALLLVDRIDWAIVSQSDGLLKQSVQDLQSYIDRTFSADSDKFKALLSPFLAHQFDVRQPLAIRNWFAEKK